MEGSSEFSQGPAPLMPEKLSVRACAVHPNVGRPAVSVSEQFEDSSAALALCAKLGVELSRKCRRRAMTSRCTRGIHADVERWQTPVKQMHTGGEKRLLVTASLRASGESAKRKEAIDRPLRQSSFTIGKHGSSEFGEICGIGGRCLEQQFKRTEPSQVATDVLSCF